MESNFPAFKIIEGDSYVQLLLIKSESIDTVFTSPEPPYNYDELRKLEAIMLQLPRVLKKTGSIWVNMGDVHNANGVLSLIPERFVYDMVVEYGWQLRNTIIWYRDAQTFDCEDMRRWRRDHEYLYWFVKDVKKHFIVEKTWADSDVIKARYEPARPGIFESGFPMELIERTALYTTPPGGRILDPFCGTGITGITALEHRREFLGIERKPELIPLINKRLSECQLRLT